MTGRDLIVYILENGLENEPVVKNGKIIGFMTISEVASKMNVGLPTISVWILQGRLDHIKIGGAIYIPANFKLKEIKND